jgi:hypothetical protein
VKAEVREHRGAPTLFLDGVPTFASMQWLSAPLAPDGSRPNERDTRAFAGAGVHHCAITVGNEWCGPRPGKPEHFDFSPLEPYLRGVLRADPQALFHLRIYLETAPWWNELYPEECEVDSEGRRLNMSYASEVWREEV